MTTTSMFSSDGAMAGGSAQLSPAQHLAKGRKAFEDGGRISVPIALCRCVFAPFGVAAALAIRVRMGYLGRNTAETAHVL